MANIDLTKYGITGTKEVVYNPSYDELYKEEITWWEVKSQSLTTLETQPLKKKRLLLLILTQRTQSECSVNVWTHL